MGSDCNDTTCRVGLKLRLLYDCIKRECFSHCVILTTQYFSKRSKNHFLQSFRGNICSDCFAAGKFKNCFPSYRCNSWITQRFSFSAVLLIVLNFFINLHCIKITLTSQFMLLHERSQMFDLLTRPKPRNYNSTKTSLKFE